MRYQYLYGDAARDVSRMTGLPWHWARISTHGPRQPYLDVEELPPWDRFRVAWALIGGHYWCDYHDALTSGKKVWNSPS